MSVTDVNFVITIVFLVFVQSSDKTNLRTVATINLNARVARIVDHSDSNVVFGGESESARESESNSYDGRSIGVRRCQRADGRNAAMASALFLWPVECFDIAMLYVLDVQHFLQTKQLPTGL